MENSHKKSQYFGNSRRENVTCGDFFRITVIP
jgi:hypothetical protein